MEKAIIKNIREVMNSGTYYNPNTLEYLYKDSLNMSNEFLKYKIKCRKLNLKYNKLNAKQLHSKHARKILNSIFGNSDKPKFIEPPFYANFGGKHTKILGSFFANYNLTLIEDGEIIINDNVMLGPNVTLCTADHNKNIDFRIKYPGYLLNKKIIIGKNVWIGANCVILPGVAIGDGSIIGAGSIVTKDIPSSVIAAGVPCKVIKSL